MENYFGNKCKHKKITRKKEKGKTHICKHGGNLCKELNNCCEQYCPINYGYLINSKSGEF
jgi:hypothetical protein